MRAFFALVFFGASLFAQEDCPVILKNPKDTKTFGELRVKMIRGWDKLITWALTPKSQPYALKTPREVQSFIVNNQELFQFDENYGFFSFYHPIVGTVTDSKRDIRATNCLLEALGDFKNPVQLQFSQDEILAKVMAYRSLKKGMIIIHPSGGNYVVDEVINLWKGMPAFGLIPESNEEPPILLFRGTDLDLTSEKGWASIVSDLDVNGPGHSTYLRANTQIRKWLKKMAEKGTPPRLVGFSLGGVFVLFTMIYDYEFVSKEHFSSAFNPPGLSEEVFQKWLDLSEENRVPHYTYVNQGDFVSKIGLFLSNVWEVSLPKPMNVIESHVSLISVKDEFKLTAVNVERENESRE